jgi:hypothetical protein
MFLLAIICNRTEKENNIFPTKPILKEHLISHHKCKTKEEEEKKVKLEIPKPTCKMFN